jgi:hypothetical protein
MFYFSSTSVRLFSDPIESGKCRRRVEQESNKTRRRINKMWVMCLFYSVLAVNLIDHNIICCDNILIDNYLCLLAVFFDTKISVIGWNGRRLWDSEFYVLRLWVGR